MYKTNFDLGFKTNKLFDDEINKYSYNWRSGGQFAKKNETVNTNDELFSNWTLYIFITYCNNYFYKTDQHGN